MSFNKRFFVYVIILSLFFGVFSAFVSVGGFFKLKKNVRVFYHRLFSADEKKAVEVVMTQYLTAWQNYAPAEMYKLIAAADRAEISEADYLKQFEEFPLRPSAYVLKEIYLIANGAMAVYNIAWPDFSTDENLMREEEFFLIREDSTWRIKEEVSLIK